MWIVEVALRRPYTFLVMALLILLATPLVLLKMSTDIFPEINIPVISIVWTYSGLSAQEIGQRITAVNERSLTTTVNDIEHIESQSLAGLLDHQDLLSAERQHPDRHCPGGGDRAGAIAPVAARHPAAAGASSTRHPASRSSSWGCPARRMTEQAVFDAAVNFLRPRLVTIPGVAIP